MQLSSSDILTEIKLYKTKIIIKSTELDSFLKYLDDTVFKRSYFFCNPNKETATPSFSRAFGTLSNMEQADYYLACLKIAFDFTSAKCSPEEQSESKREKVEMLYRLENKQWKKTNVTIYYKPAVLEIQCLDTKLKMQNYILRMSSTNKKHAFVLQSTKPECLPQTVRLGLTQLADFKEVIPKIKSIVFSGLKAVISKKMGLSRDSREYAQNWYQARQCISVEMKEKPALQGRLSLRRMIKQKQTPQIEPSKESIEEIVTKELIQNDLIERLDNFEDYELAENGYFVHRTLQRIRKSCVFQTNSVSLEWLIEEMMNHEHFALWKKSLLSIFVIGDLKRQCTRFFHEINIYTDGQQIDYVYMRHKFVREGTTYIIDKSISTAEYDSHETSGSRGKIQHILWRIQEDDDHLIEVIVEAEITHIPCKDIYQAMNEQIGQLENIVVCLNAEEALKNHKLNPLISFYSMSDNDFSPKGSEEMGEIDRDSKNQSHSESQFYSIDPRNRESQFLSIVDRTSQISALQRERSSLIKKQQAQRYQIEPSNPKQKMFRPYFKGFFFDEDECVTNNKGDLVFTNKEKIKAQGGVILAVLRKMGSNLFSGKNVLNVSFPIEIFAADTNLERLCKGMAYAPHFLENKINSTPLQRMKAAICFSIGNLLLYIDMAKPFNPILGETYQAFIDGCPVYGEQTVHHPPVSSLFLQGRDYFVSGNIEATVQLGVNSVSGTNSGEYRIAFNKQDPKKNVIIFTSPPGELKGVIYGQRRLNITGSSRFLDPQSKLFCELHWGSKKTKNPVSRFHDYLQGTIIELYKPSASLQKVKLQEKDTILGYITGRWTQTVFFDDQPIFEVNNLKPFLVTDEKRPLESDSRFRMDRVYVERGKITEAQNAKQRLQEIQRRDRRLRKQYH